MSYHPIYPTDTTIADNSTVTVTAIGSTKSANVFNVNTNVPSTTLDPVKAITEVQLNNTYEPASSISNEYPTILKLRSEMEDSTGIDASGQDNSLLGGDSNPRQAQIILNSYDTTLTSPYVNESSILFDAQYIHFGDNNPSDTTVDFTNTTVLGLPSGNNIISDTDTPLYQDTVDPISGNSMAQLILENTNPSTTLVDKVRLALVYENATINPAPTQSTLQQTSQLSLVVERWNPTTSQWLPGTTLMAFPPLP